MGIKGLGLRFSCQKDGFKVNRIDNGRSDQKNILKL